MTVNAMPMGAMDFVMICKRGERETNPHPEHMAMRL
jgi:hypothetical protein